MAKPLTQQEIVDLFGTLPLHTQVFQAAWVISQLNVHTNVSARTSWTTTELHRWATKEENAERRRALLQEKESVLLRDLEQFRHTTAEPFGPTPREILDWALTHQIELAALITAKGA